MRLMLLFVFIVSLQVSSEESINIALFFDEDSLSVFLPEQGFVNLTGFGFEVDTSLIRMTKFLEDIPAFRSFRFGTIPTPICFRLVRFGSNRPAPLECVDRQSDVIVQNLADSDIFWFDPLTNQTRTMLILDGINNVIDFCGAGETRCDFAYQPENIEPTPTLAPLSTNTPITSTLTATTPPLQPPTESRIDIRQIGYVSNLNTDARLNIRRQPTSGSESVGLLALDTPIIIIGSNEAGTWYQIEYEKQVGWIDTRFVTLVGRGAMEQPTLSPTPLSNRIIATVLLDPGANLNLRKQPNASAEAVAQIPSGEILVVLERFDNLHITWIKVIYQGLEGWAAAKSSSTLFVELSLNGNPLNLEDVPEASEN